MKKSSLIPPFLRAHSKAVAALLMAFAAGVALGQVAPVTAQVAPVREKSMAGQVASGQVTISETASTARPRAEVGEAVSCKQYEITEKNFSEPEVNTTAIPLTKPTFTGQEKKSRSVLTVTHTVPPNIIVDYEYSVRLNWNTPTNTRQHITGSGTVYGNLKKPIIIEYEHPTFFRYGALTITPTACRKIRVVKPEPAPAKTQQPAEKSLTESLDSANPSGIESVYGEGLPAEMRDEAGQKTGKNQRAFPNEGKYCAPECLCVCPKTLGQE
jgi:hypothetical protein